MGASQAVRPPPPLLDTSPLLPDNPGGGSMSVAPRKGWFLTILCFSNTAQGGGRHFTARTFFFFCFVFLSSSEHLKPTLGWHFQGTHPQALALSACCSQPYPRLFAGGTCDQAPFSPSPGKGATRITCGPVLPQDGLGHRKRRRRTIQGEGLASPLVLSLSFQRMHRNAKALGPKGWGNPAVWGSSLPLKLLQSPLHHLLSGSSVAAHHAPFVPHALWERSLFSREEAGSFSCWNTEMASEVSPGPGKPTPVTAPRSTRRLITVSPRSPPLSPRGAGRRDGDALPSVSTTRGAASGRSEINIKRRFCVFSESNTRSHARPALRCPPGLGRAVWPCPQAGGLTWPGPPAGGAACRWGARPTRREARAAAESSGGRTCG